jgi:hypothetical protein
METLHELNKFDHIKYHDEPHHYFINGKLMTSATTFIGKFKNKFDSDGQAEKYANKHGLLKENVLSEWDHKRDYSTIKGSAVHNYAENHWNNKIFPYNPLISINRFGEDIVKPAYEKCVKLFDKFYQDSRINLIPLKSEFVVGDEELGICGMIDQLFWNKKVNQIQIWDWKTNKAINTKSAFKNRFKDPISHLDECEFNTYSLQLSLYKYIIEKNTNLVIGDMYFVWFFEGNDSYQVFKCQDMRNEIEMMLKAA